MSDISQYNIDKLVEVFRGIARQEARKAAGEYRTTAMGTVSRIANDGVIWVNLNGSDIETPVAVTSSEVKQGQQVSVVIRNGYASITGNVSDPAAGSSRVTNVEGDIVKVVNHVDMVKTELVEADRVLARDIEADHARFNTLDTEYARIDAANIGTETVQNSWINKLMVQTGLLATDGTIFTLDAIQVNAANITAGTLDVERLVVTVNGEKYLVHVDPGTGTPSYEKLDGGVIEDLTITTDKLVAGAVTADKITTANIEGPGGWINLRNGTFLYSNAETGDGISWDGRHLRIGAAATIAGVDVETIIAASDQIVYDHSYEYDSEAQRYSFTATVTKGGVDVTNTYDNDFFIWYLKTESDTTFLGRGKQIDIPASSAIYTGTVLGALEDYLDYGIEDDTGAVIVTDEGDVISVRVFGTTGVREDYTVIDSDADVIQSDTNDDIYAQVIWEV